MTSEVVDLIYENVEIVRVVKHLVEDVFRDVLTSDKAQKNPE